MANKNFKARNGLTAGGTLSASNINLSDSYPTVSPSLNLDFAKSKSLDSRITYTRSTTATYMGSDGLIKTAAINEPRFEHDPITKVCKGLLIEESRTNILFYSSAQDNGVWSHAPSPNNSVITPDSGLAPDGTMTADKVVPASGVSASWHPISPLVSAGQTYTLSAFIKASGTLATSVSLSYYNTTDGDQGGKFNPQTGAYIGLFNTIAPISTTSTAYPNGWFRISITFTPTTNTTFNCTHRFNGWTGNGIDGYYIWGVQLEAGAFPTSYIPTTSSAVTRNADLPYINGTNFSSFYNQSEGTVVSSFLPTVAAIGNAYGMVWQINDNTNNNNIVLLRSDTSSTFYYVVQVGAVAQSISSWNATQNTIYATALAYKTNDFGFSINGGTTIADNFGNLPAVTQLCIGNNYFGNQLNGTISKLVYYPKRLSDAQLQLLSV
jgi:hypothetical protein